MMPDVAGSQTIPNRLRPEGVIINELARSTRLEFPRFVQAGIVDGLYTESDQVSMLPGFTSKELGDGVSEGSRFIFPSTGLKGASILYGRMPKPKEQQIQIPPGTVVGGVDVNLALEARYRRGLYVGLVIGIVVGVVLGFVL